MKACGASIGGDAPAVRAGQGGSTPTAPLFDKHCWEVRPCRLELARALVAEHHYSGGGSNTAVLTAGLFPKTSLWDVDCAGVTWWIPPTKTAARRAYPQRWQGVLMLSRLVVVPGAPSNACSFLLRHSMRFLDRGRWPLLLTFADEWRGHTGSIYLAAGWQVAGWTKPERRYTLNGRMVSRKAGPQTRTHAEMLSIGCVLVGSFRCKRFIHEAKTS